MITRKAALGFILLAVIVFPFAYALWTPDIVTSSKPVYIEKQQYRDDSVKTNIEYRTPLVRFKTPLETAIVVTASLEIFALLCYSILKKIEPTYKAWEASERLRVYNK
jgi:hypothetical protein